jgi:thioredoxin:protein disulfide reductase
VFISQTRDVVLGGIALFAMAMGMSVPLLLVGVSAGSLLPRAGAWMERVKQVFGMMLFAVAIWMVSPVMAAALHMVLWAAWFLAAGALLGVFGTASAQQTRTPVASRASGAAAIAVALVLLVGASSGGQSVLQPLAHFRGASAAAAGTPSNATVGNPLQFAKVASLAQLDAEIAEARRKGQAVMLEFYADWCVACKEFEAFTFSDPSVQSRLGKFRLLQADVTANNSDDRALMKRFGLFGPPGVLFFDRAGGNEPVHKVIGFQNAAEFSGSLDLIPTITR